MDRKKATCVCIRIYIHKTEVESYTKKSNDESYFEKWIKVFKHKERIERQKNAKMTAQSMEVPSSDCKGSAALPRFTSAYAKSQIE